MDEYPKWKKRVLTSECNDRSRQKSEVKRE